ncbi:flagellar export protein FliJ [Pseudaeromonas sp. ZJS20]|uniref:flagellar export protein FliJ n=1 Tax=Pseudaeromonas aegiceratis TaxID=3153928 RepID=UPI00390CDAA0
MSKALTLLAERIKEAEDRAARVLALARQDQQRYEQQLGALNEYRQIYSQQLGDKAREGMGRDQLSHYQAFINKLDNAAQQQQQGVRQVRAVAQQRQQEWQQLQQKRKAMETLLERQATREALRQARQEQKLLDEFATIQHFHRQQREI